MKKAKGLAMFAAITMAVGNVAVDMPLRKSFAAYGTGNNIVENLNRGISAVNTGSGMLVSWRFLANDANNAVFRLYRDNTLIYTSDNGKATCYLDKGGNSKSAYRVDTLSGNAVVSSDSCGLVSNQNYINIPMQVPAGGADYTYSPNDCSVGDVDGDGTYELFVKWDPSNSKDNAHAGITGNVYIDCYTLSGKRLWRVDLGRNIRAGAHYTQFLVADFDGDGKAEMTCKTADGTVDGAGKVIGDASKNYGNASGYILNGPEYYTLFDGATGAALDTVNYEYPRGEVSAWGDSYGNRCDRYLGAVMYCNGVTPSAVSVRGYYTRMTAVAYDVVNKKLVKRWGFDTGNNPFADGYGNGNHNCMPADVDNDGKQELVLGATCLDDNGTVLWCNKKGHGDAMHLGDFLPDRPGLELWVCHEHAPYGVSLIDPANGKDIFHKDGDKDTGRCCAANIYAGNPGAEFWGARPAGVVMDGKGNSTGIAVPSMNYLIYWDGDLEREIQSGTGITKVNSSKKIDTLLNAGDCESNNGTKATPNLTADLFGDWREELVLRTADNKNLRIYCTTSTTDYRITTLMHDVQYRTQVAGEQVAYDQPAHTSFYLGSDQPLPDRPAVTVGKGAEPISGRLIADLTVKDNANGSNWHIVDGIETGMQVFGDRDFTFTSLPYQLKGAEMIQTACDSKNSTGELAAFTAAKDMTVFIAFDHRVEQVPDWVKDFTKTSMTAQSSNEVTFDIYSKEVKTGESITLGLNGQSSYCVNYVVFASDAVMTTLKGDVNADGVFDISDVVMMQKWLLNRGTLTDWKAGDLWEDDKIDAFDFCLIKKLLIEKPSVPETSSTPYHYSENLVFTEMNQSYRNDIANGGTVEKFYYTTNSYDAANLSLNKYANVYLPYGYGANDKSKKYNVLYLMHGGGENPDTAFQTSGNSGYMKQILDNMIAKNELEPMIVVSPTFYNDGQSDATAMCENFHNELCRDLVPMLESKYNTYAESTDYTGLQGSRYHRAFAGFSMGALTTWYVYMNSQDYFAYFMPISGDYWGGSDANDKAAKVAQAALEKGYGNGSVFIMAATGKKDIAYDALSSQIEAMKKQTSAFTYTSDFSKGNLYLLLSNGEHTWNYVSQYLYHAMPTFFHEGK